jgi:hypothetical protein
MVAQLFDIVVEIFVVGFHGVIGIKIGKPRVGVVAYMCCIARKGRSTFVKPISSRFQDGISNSLWCPFQKKDELVEVAAAGSSPALFPIVALALVIHPPSAPEADFSIGYIVELINLVRLVS